uniref:Uncharacterized protein n=1 Tax=Steinernema glaseri TaxID=37863 RepID=A0A1I8AM58_9BILA
MPTETCPTLVCHLSVVIGEPISVSVNTISKFTLIKSCDVCRSSSGHSLLRWHLSPGTKDKDAFRVANASVQATLPCPSTLLFAAEGGDRGVLCPFGAAPSDCHLSDPVFGCIISLRRRRDTRNYPLSPLFSRSVSVSSQPELRKSDRRA